MGCIYQAKNKITDKCYIGKTIQKLETRIYNHNTYSKIGKDYFHAALKKYGQHGFDWTVLYLSDDDKILCEQEKYFIQLLGTKSPNGYNLTDGGEGMSGYKFTDEQRLMRSIIRAGETRSHEIKQKMSIIQKELNKKLTIEERQERLKKMPSMKGRKHSKETKNKIGAANRGKIMTDEQKRKLSFSHIGKKHSEETKKKISKANIKKIVSQETRDKLRNINIGRKFSKETIKKMKDAKCIYWKNKKSDMGGQNVSRK